MCVFKITVNLFLKMVMMVPKTVMNQRCSRMNMLVLFLSS